MTSDLKIENEWDLAQLHRRALSCEDFQLCAEIQKEVDFRIENNAIRHEFMQGFRYYNPQTQQFEGPYQVNELNGLFDKYIQRHPV